MIIAWNMYKITVHLANLSVSIQTNISSRNDILKLFGYYCTKKSSFLTDVEIKLF